MLSIELPVEIEYQLELLSMVTGRSKQFYARAAIVEYLDEIEDRYHALQQVEEAENTYSPEDANNPNQVANREE
ncbi:MAG: hypothetical protein RL120_04970 [Gammaproteobacteria bacterium]